MMRISMFPHKFTKTQWFYGLLLCLSMLKSALKKAIYDAYIYN